MNPFDDKNSVPNHWLSCIIIHSDAMCAQARGEHKAVYMPEHGKSCPTEILETLAEYNAEGRPIWKPMHMQPIYRLNDFVTREGSSRGLSDATIAGSLFGADGKPINVSADIFNRGLCLPSDIKMTAEEQEKIIEIIRSCFE